MRTWKRAPIEQACGGPCGHRIYRGQPMLVFSIPSVERTFARCLQCAGEPCPTDLPPLAQVQVPITPTLKRGRSARLPFASASTMAVDFKGRQAGDE